MGIRIPLQSKQIEKLLLIQYIYVLIHKYIEFSEAPISNLLYENKRMKGI